MASPWSGVYHFPELGPGWWRQKAKEEDLHQAQATWNGDFVVKACSDLYRTNLVFIFSYMVLLRAI